LNLNTPKHFRAKTIRDNLYISCEPRIGNGKNQILSFLKSHKGLCGIIYTFTRKEAESTASFLQENGYSAKAYHAGISTEVKNAVFNDFVYEKIDIVVATIAFGMGIDKSNIRFVLHTSLPKTLENYYQEIGRAGRDGDVSYVHMLYSKNDEIKRKIQIDEALDNAYKTTALEKLETMYRYCVSNQCRHKLIASYFEDTIDECKTLCDNCTKGEVELIDISIEAQKFLSAVYRSEQRFGINHIIDILRGSKNQKVLEFAHNQLSVYGLGSEISKNQWIALTDRLIDIEAVSLGEFRAVKFQPLGFEILKGNQKVFLESDKFNIEQKEAQHEEEQSVDELIYERFKRLRKEIALSHEVPAYVIFGDKSLKELASKLPTTKEEMLRINGVGEVKFEKYGEMFLALCLSIKEEFEQQLEQKVPLKKLTKTYLDTFELLEESKSVEEIAQIRDLGLSTIISHINLLCEHQKISPQKRTELLAPLEIPQEIKQWIEEGLKQQNLRELRQYLSLYEHLYTNA
jgi:ATP-dependent DNA helicase RecQ